jgi:hypothetical protein
VESLQKRSLRHGPCRCWQIDSVQIVQKGTSQFNPASPFGRLEDPHLTGLQSGFGCQVSGGEWESDFTYSLCLNVPRRRESMVSWGVVFGHGLCVLGTSILCNSNIDWFELLS